KINAACFLSIFLKDDAVFFTASSTSSSPSVSFLAFCSLSSLFSSFIISCSKFSTVVSILLISTFNAAISSSFFSFTTLVLFSCWLPVFSSSVTNEETTGILLPAFLAQSTTLIPAIDKIIVVTVITTITGMIIAKKNHNKGFILSFFCFLNVELGILFTCLFSKILLNGNFIHCFIFVFLQYLFFILLTMRYHFFEFFHFNVCISKFALFDIHFIPSLINLSL